jgi:prepilin-type N-terminal cleavage/methylation domain-containing protein
MNSKDNNKKNKVQGFTLVEVIVALTILAIIMAMFTPSLTSYLDKAYESKATAECKYVITATQSELITLYANGNLSQYIERDGFTVTSNTIKEINNKLFDQIQELSETEGEIQCIWIDESDMSVVGLAYLIADETYYVIYAPKTEEKNYVFSAKNEYNDYKSQLRKLKDSKWK